ncbi:MAG: hypothetical protein JWM03_845 [Rhodocyclales bacterium]|nr:hypothetical protein [Rhodocyclales bacterium]
MPFAVSENPFADFSITTVTHQEKVAVLHFSIDGISAQINCKNPKDDEIGYT